MWDIDRKSGRLPRCRGDISQVHFARYHKSWGRYCFLPIIPLSPRRRELCNRLSEKDRAREREKGGGKGGFIAADAISINIRSIVIINTFRKMISIVLARPIIFSRRDRIGTKVIYTIPASSILLSTEYTRNYAREVRVLCAFTLRKLADCYLPGTKSICRRHTDLHLSAWSKFAR